MIRDFPDSPVPASPITLSLDPANEEDDTKDQYEFGLIQSIVPEDLENVKKWQGDSDYEDEVEDEGEGYQGYGGKKRYKNKRRKSNKRKTNKSKKRCLNKVKRSRRRSRRF